MQRTIAVDLAKTVFEIAVSDEPGRICQRQRVRRAGLRRHLAQLQPSTVLLEACGSAHYWARELGAFGHAVVLLPPHRVRPYRLDHRKTDRTDAKALLEAYRNEEISPVPVKTPAQQGIAALHRLRSGWVATRTARLNALRGLLREFGVTIPCGRRHVVPRTLEAIAASEIPLPDPLRAALHAACDEIGGLDSQIQAVERQLLALSKNLPVTARLRSIPGIGLLTATALVAFVGDARRFRSGRHLASYLGLTPRESSSGRVRRLGRISKRGNPYLRFLLIHGARAVLRQARRNPDRDRLYAWSVQLEQRRGPQKAIIALANRIARIAWAVWCHDQTYRRKPLTA